MVSTCCILTWFLQQKEQDMISFIYETEKNFVKQKCVVFNHMAISQNIKYLVKYLVKYRKFCKTEKKRASIGCPICPISYINIWQKGHNYFFYSIYIFVFVLWSSWDWSNLSQDNFLDLQSIRNLHVAKGLTGSLLNVWRLVRFFFRVIAYNIWLIHLTIMSFTYLSDIYDT